MKSLKVFVLGSVMSLGLGAQAGSWNTQNVRFDQKAGQVTVTGAQAQELLALFQRLPVGADQNGARKVYPSTCSLLPNGTCAPVQPIAECDLNGSRCVLTDGMASLDNSDLPACYQGFLELRLPWAGVLNVIEAHPADFKSIDVQSNGAGGSEGSGGGTPILRINNDGVLNLSRSHFERIFGVPNSAVANCKQPTSFLD